MYKTFILLSVFSLNTFSSSEKGNCIPQNLNIDLIGKWEKISKKMIEENYPEYDFKKQCEQAKRDNTKHKEADLHIRVGMQIDFGNSRETYSPTIFNSKDPLLISLLAKSYLKCVEPSKSCTGVKHFPNLSIVKKDNPHLSVSKKNNFDVRKKKFDDIYPMLQSVQSGACTIMTSHIPFIGKSGDNKICTFNPECISFIRNELGFSGIIIADEIQVMLPAMYEYWDSEFRPSDPDEQKGWDKNIWELTEKESSKTKDYWTNHKEILMRKASYVFSIIKKEKCSNGICSEKEKRHLMSLILDKDSSKRLSLSIMAGNDMTFVFHEGGKQKKRLKSMIQNIESSVIKKEIKLENINESVLRILEKKHQQFNETLYQNSSLSGTNRTPSKLLKTLTLKEKIKQMVIVSGAFPGETKVAYDSEMGAVYYFRGGVNNYRGVLQKEYDAKNYTPKIPLLRLGDLVGLSYK